MKKEKNQRLDLAFDFIEKIKNQETISDVCKNHAINYSNLVHNKTSDYNKKVVAEELAKNILYLYGYAVAYLSTRGVENEKTDTL